MKASLKIFRSGTWPRSNAEQVETPARQGGAQEPATPRAHRSVLKGLAKIVSASQALVPRRSKTLENTSSRLEGRGARLNRVSSEPLSKPSVAELHGLPVSELDGESLPMPQDLSLRPDVHKAGLRRSSSEPLPRQTAGPDSPVAELSGSPVFELDGNPLPRPEADLTAKGTPRRAMDLDRLPPDARQPGLGTPDWSDKIAVVSEPPEGLMSDGLQLERHSPKDHSPAWSDKIAVVSEPPEGLMSDGLQLERHLPKDHLPAWSDKIAVVSEPPEGLISDGLRHDPHPPQFRTPDWSGKAASTDELPEALMPGGLARRSATFLPRGAPTVSRQDTGVWSGKGFVAPDEVSPITPARQATPRQPIFPMPQAPYERLDRVALAGDGRGVPAEEPRHFGMPQGPYERLDGLALARDGRGVPAEEPRLFGIPQGPSDRLDGLSLAGDGRGVPAEEPRHFGIPQGPYDRLDGLALTGNGRGVPAEEPPRVPDKIEIVQGPAPKDVRPQPVVQKAVSQPVTQESLRPAVPKKTLPTVRLPETAPVVATQAAVTKLPTPLLVAQKSLSEPVPLESVPLAVTQKPALTLRLPEAVPLAAAQVAVPPSPASLSLPVIQKSPSRPVAQEAPLPKNPPLPSRSPETVPVVAAQIPSPLSSPVSAKVRIKRTAPATPRLPTYAEAVANVPLDRVALDRMLKLIISRLEASGVKIPKSRVATPPVSPVDGAPPPYTPEYSAAAIRVMGSVAEMLLRQLVANPMLAARWGIPVPGQTGPADTPGLAAASPWVDPVS